MSPTMEVVETRDRAAIEAFFRRDTGVHIYPLADLDDLFWPDTVWYQGSHSGEVRAMVLVLRKLDPAIVYALDPLTPTDLESLLELIRGRLPSAFFLNAAQDLEDWFRERCDWDAHGVHHKMLLQDHQAADATSDEGIEALTSANLAELQDFYANAAYTATERVARFFEPYMLEVGPYFAVRESGQLIAAGGVHVNSAAQRVAAIGNVATRPDRRGLGHGRAITAAVCRALASSTDHIGLNVEQNNTAAIRCYQGLGFRRVCSYIEATVTGWS